MLQNDLSSVIPQGFRATGVMKIWRESDSMLMGDVRMNPNECSDYFQSTRYKPRLSPNSMPDYARGTCEKETCPTLEDAVKWAASNPHVPDPTKDNPDYRVLNSVHLLIVERWPNGLALCKHVYDDPDLYSVVDLAATSGKFRATSQWFLSNNHEIPNPIQINDFSGIGGKKQKSRVSTVGGAYRKLQKIAARIDAAKVAS